MSAFIGFKSTLMSLIGGIAVFITLLYTVPHWRDLHQQLALITLPFILIVMIFCAQFNRSRMSILCGIWLVFFITKGAEHIFFEAPSWWLTLSASFIFMALATMKDRAILSSHFLSSMVLFLILAGIAFLWLTHSMELINLISVIYLSAQVKALLPVGICLLLCGCTLLWCSLRHRDLTSSCLFISAIVWVCFVMGRIALPYDIVVFTMVCIILFATFIESYHLAYRDDLTGLPTRRALNHLALSIGRRYTVAMLDIDHFKKFNDTYGHDIGDQVLKLVATKLVNIQGGGKVFRYGGEEFTVVFPRRDMDYAVNYLEALRENIANYDMVIREVTREGKKFRSKQNKKMNKVVNVTVSIGVAQRQPKQLFDQVLKEADLALYRAKKSGRNNVSE